VTVSAPVIEVGGPWYEDLAVGDRFDESPGLTLTEGLAALHQAILGDRLRLALDAPLSRSVLGGVLAHPGLVCDIAIGQSTLPTHRVIGNLFYRGLVLQSAPVIGDTLRTSTEIVALRDNSARPGRAPTGIAVLRVRTLDQDGRPVLDFHRAAMLPMRSEQARPGHADELDAISAELSGGLLAGVAAFDLEAFPHGSPPVPGARYVIETGDTVSCALELVRLSLNVAGAHSDPGASGRGQRLVYGGHTIGIAFAHVVRALPDLVTVAGWRSCDHLGPVFEGDVLHSAVTVEDASVDGGLGAALVGLRVETSAWRGDDRVPVLDWRLVAVMAA
jgi:acyl dehydratase